MNNNIWRTHENIAIEAFDGMMASDATIERRSRRFVLALSGKEHFDWLHYAKLVLMALGVRASEPTAARRIDYNGRPYDQCYVRSRVSSFMAEQRDRWYPNGVKIIPSDCHFSPRWLAHCFMGDGNSGIKQRKGRAATLRTRLGLLGFDEDSIQLVESFLREKGLKTYRERKKCVKRGAGITISLWGNYAEALIELVRPYVLPSYQYKTRCKEVIL